MARKILVALYNEKELGKLRARLEDDKNPNKDNVVFMASNKHAIINLAINNLKSILIASEVYYSKSSAGDEGLHDPVQEIHWETKDTVVLAYEKEYVTQDPFNQIDGVIDGSRDPELRHLSEIIAAITDEITAADLKAKFPEYFIVR